jgi:hypothetical protein
MPVGWAPSPQQLLNRHNSKVENPSAAEPLRVFAVIVLLLFLIALMPEFDGTQNTDWGEQEGDKEKPE